MTAWLPWLLTALVTASSQGLPADLEPASLMTTPVLLMNGTRAVSQGTGFFFASTTLDGKPDTVFLVTNYHVVTGRPPLTPGPRAGDRIRFILHENPAELTRVRQIELPLYDQRGDPLWVVSEAVPKADVVLVPVPPEAYRDISLLVFTEAHTRGDIRIRPSSGATLLGYPYGFYDESHFLPVWKTGHVASEPSVDFNDLPTFLVDVSAFPGMSGSPVLAVANGIYESEDGTMRSGRVLKLLGIFSAMPVVREKKPAEVNGLAETQTTEINLQLGYVWKAALIADVAKTYRPRR
jgi:Trypsin-like peptidase domain